MPRPRRVSDEEVFVAVRRAVAAQGPQVSLDVVAESLGVTAPALFRRFGSRGAILLAALGADLVPPFIPALDAGPDDRPIAAQLGEVIERIASYLSTALPCILALRESGLGPADLPGRAEAPPVRAARAIAGWLRRAADRGLLHVEDPDDAAMAVLGAVQAPVFLHHVAKREGALDVAAYSGRLTRMLLDGMAPRPAAPSQTRSPRHDRPAPDPPGRKNAPAPARARPVRAAQRGGVQKKPGR